MFFRQLFPVARIARPCFTTSVRGLRNLSAKPPIPLSLYEEMPPKQYNSRAGLWTEPWLYPDPRIYPLRPYEDPAMVDYARRLDRYLRFSAWRKAEALEKGVHAEILKARLQKDGLLLELNVSHYEPDELQVKVVGDRLVITGKHTHRPDEHGFVSREFTREFLLPEGVNHESLTARLTESDSRLIIAGNIDNAKQGRSISIEYDAGEREGHDLMN